MSVGRSSRRSLGRQFNWLWSAYAASAYGSGLGLGAFSVVAIRVLHAGPAQVSALSAVGLGVGSIVAVPLGPWIESRRKRPVMIAMDLIRFVAMMSVPTAFAFGRLTFIQLLAVSVVVAAAKIGFTSASGANLKVLVRPEDLLVANARFETTTWSAVVLGPPLGGAAIGTFGPVTTVTADAISYLLSALGISAIRGHEDRPEPSDPPPLRSGDLRDGWRYILRHPGLRPVFFNVILVNGLILATEPLVAVLMLGRPGFAPWEYGLAFGAPSIGGLVGSRSARRLAGRFGQQRVMVVAGTVRACWPIGLAFIRPGVAGIVLVIVLQLGLVTSIGIFNPVYATYRLEQTATSRVARTLSAWSVTSSATIALTTALWGLLASVIGARSAIAVAGGGLLMTPILLLRHAVAQRPVESAPRSSSTDALASSAGR